MPNGAESRTCRFWSDMMAYANSDGMVCAACLAQGGKYQQQFMPADGYCEGFKSDHFGKVDAPPDYGEAALFAYIQDEGPSAMEAAR